MQIVNLQSKTGKFVPLLVPSSFEPAFKFIEDVKDSCGAGDGWGERLVPESIYGLRVSVACAIHDIMYDSATPLWSSFYLANAAMCFNILMLISYLSKNSILATLRIYRAATYFAAVNMTDTAKSTFWNLKVAQYGLSSIPSDAKLYTNS